MKRGWIAAAVVLGAASMTAAPASGANENASCVGQFSSYFAHGAEGTHRSEIAQYLAEAAHPAGRNVYSEVAHRENRGSVEECRS